MKKLYVIDMAERLLTDDEYFRILQISLDNKIYDSVVCFDRYLGGVGIHSINKGNKGRYDIRDRDVFRPIQYIDSYLKMDYDVIEWVTREIVHMCGLHLESMVKRLFAVSKLPLGQALAMNIAYLKLDKQIIKDLKLIVKPYNEAKHYLEHEKDSHLFDIETALFCYAATRKLACRLYPLVKIYTPESVWK